MFKRRHFPVEIILVCVRWYCKYGISYHDLSEIMQERGVEVDSSTIMRWVHRFPQEATGRTGISSVGQHKVGQPAMLVDSPE